MSTDNSQILLRNVRTNIQKVTQSIKQIESIEQKIGTPKDSNDLRDVLKRIQTDSKNLLGVCQANLKDLHSLTASKSGDLKFQKDRLTDELIKTVGSLQRAAKSAMEKQKKFDLPGSAAFFSNNQSHSIDLAEMAQDHNNGLGIVEQQNQIQRTKSVELQMVTDRNNDLINLESDMTDLNQIFKDLAVIIQDQGETIDNIEMNVEVTLDTVIFANEKLIDANFLNKKARKKKMCLWLILVMFLIVVAVVLYFIIKPYVS